MSMETFAIEGVSTYYYTIRNMKIHVANVKPLQLIINNQKNIVSVILSLTIKNIIVRLYYGVMKLRRREIEVLQIIRKTS